MAEPVLPVARELPDHHLLLENQHLRFEIDPAHGGRIASFVVKRDGRERVVPGRVAGLCFDGFYDQDAMLHQGQWGVDQAPPYEGRILESSDPRARVAVGREVIAAEHRVPNVNYEDLHIEREFILEKNAPILKIVVRIHNRAAEGRRPAYFIRNGYMDGPERGDIRYIRPSRRGVLVGGPADPSTDQMVWDPSAGWTATLDAATGRGVVWLMDPGQVMMFYNCLSAVTGRHIEEFPNQFGVDPLWIWDNASDTAITAEWYYRRSIIPAGSTWETTIEMLPFETKRTPAKIGEEIVARFSPEHYRPETLRRLQYERRLAPRTPNPKPRVLFLEGLAFERWGLADALARAGAEVRESEFMKRRIATCVRYFPATLDEALGYDLIILGAVDAFSLSDEGVALLDDYVQSGGSLLVLGGLYSWGGGRFQEYGLDTFLPLRVKRTFDLLQPGGVKVEWLPAAPVGPAEWRGSVPWMHDMTLADGAQLWARAGDRPLVAARQHGRGRIVAFAATTLGASDPATKPFWAQRDQAAAADRILRWLLDRE